MSLESDHNFYAGITDNISEGGIFVALDPPLPSGALVEIELRLLDASFKLRGEVRWVRTERMSSEGMPVGCGIRWVDIGEEAVQAILQFTRSRDTLFYEE